MKKGTVIAGFFLSFLAGMLLIRVVDSNRSHAATADITAEGAPAGAGTLPSKANPGAVPVVLHVMSQCPYGVKAEDAFKDVVKQLGADVDLRLEFIGDEQGGQLTAMHGPKEVKGNIAQICAMKHSPKWFDLVLCQNQNYREVDTNWESCAAQAGIPVEPLRACIEGEEGKSLLATSYKKSKELGARGSPTIFIGGQKYEGGRRPHDLMRAVCNAHGGPRPAACSNIPEPAKVNVTLLTDKRCPECDTAQIEGVLRSRVAAPVISKLDYGDAEGKALYDQIKPALLPVAIFDKTLDGDKEAAAMLSRGMKNAGDHRVLSIGGAWNPACADDGGCELDECAKTLQCRKEEPNKLEVFVMSECPYGVRGLNAMEEVLANFDKAGAALDFEIHFIGDGDAQNLKAMHGQTEVDENIREICAIKHYPKDRKYMEYILCRNKNIRSKDWESCTGGTTGIDTAVIKACFEGDEGKQLLADSYAYAKSLGIGASPTWLANGRHKFSGVDPQTIKTNICKHNQLAGCDATLAGPDNAAPAANCGN